LANVLYEEKMTYKAQVIAVTTLLLWQTLLSYGQNAPVKMTFLGREPFESEYNTAQYQCHLSEPDNIAATAHVESFRTVWTRNDANENVDPPAPVWNDGIYKLWRVTLDNYGNNDAFGVFGCEAALDGRISTSISGIFMRSDGEEFLSPLRKFVTPGVGGYKADFGLTLVIFSGEKFDLCFTRLWLEVRLLFWSIAGKKLVQLIDGAQMLVVVYVITAITEAFVMRIVENAFVLLDSKEQIVKKVVEVTDMETRVRRNVQALTYIINAEHISSASPTHTAVAVTQDGRGWTVLP
ncbi:hypothetical protein BSL78_29158, partial [Apostichopus japonicus]